MTTFHDAEAGDSPPADTSSSLGHPHDQHPAFASFVHRLRALAAVPVLVLLALSAVLSVRALDEDSGHHLESVLRAIGTDVARLRWQYFIVVVVLAIAHYVAAAVAARAASGLPLRLRETMLVQFAASAANRLTPAGLGGSAVNARFFARRGLSVPAAVGAVIVLDVLSAVGDVLVIAVLAAVGHLLGLGGAPAVMSLLTSKLYALGKPLRTWWSLAAIAALAMVAIFLRRHLTARARDLLHRLGEPVRNLRHRPAALVTLLAAAGSTTLLLAFAFVASIAMIPGPQPNTAIGGLLVGFMLGSAASNAVPTPAGVGSTETALVLVLVTVGLPSARAVEIVIMYRVITFWLPAVAGLITARHLRRTGAL